MQLACDRGQIEAIELAAREVRDVDRDCLHEPAIVASPFVRALAIDDSPLEQQTLIGGGAACEFSRTIASPLTGCRFGVATVAVQPLAGATYVWRVEGGAILSGAGTDRLVVGLGEGTRTDVSVVITANGCSMTAMAVIPLLEPLAITAFTATGGTHAGEPVTLTWTFSGYDPATQVLTGPDFVEPVRVPRTQRIYTFVPRASGKREIALFAAIPATTHVNGRRRSATASIHSSNCATASSSVTITTP